MTSTSSATTSARAAAAAAATVSPTMPSLARTKASEFYTIGLQHIRDGALEQAALALSTSAFYAADSANPTVALAEVYVFLCDLPSAVHHYRRAIWMMQKPVREQRRAEEQLLLQRERAALLDLGELSPLRAGDTHGEGATAGGSGAPHSTLHAGSTGPTMPASSPWGSAPPPAFPPPPPPPQRHMPVTLAGGLHGDGGVTPTAAHLRLAGLLDALSLSLFRLHNFSQAHRYAQEALDVLADLKAVKSTGRDKAAAAAALREHAPALQLHKCVCLMALRRAEEAEIALETHLETWPALSVQCAALLIQLYAGRQAFLKARRLVDNFSAEEVHQHRVLTVARHIFSVKYHHYRAKALEKRDIGTLSQCLDVYPGDTDLLFARAQIRIAAGDLQRSVKDLFRCIKESNATHKDAIDAMTRVLIQMGEASSLSNGSDACDTAAALGDAVSYYTESLKWQAGNRHVLLARADCYVRLEDYEQALADYQAVLQLHPDDATATQRVAFLHDIWGRKLYAAGGKLREAEAEFTQAIRTDGTVALFYYHRALCRFELQEPRYGLRDVLSCQELNPTDPVLRAFIVRYLGTAESPASGGSGGVPGTMVPRADPAGGRAGRAAALYGRPSARITKAIRAAHDDRSATANNGGATEAATAQELLHIGSPPQGELAEPPSLATGRGRLAYGDFVQQLEQAGAGAGVASVRRGCRTVSSNDSTTQRRLGAVTGSRASLHTRPEQ